MKIDVRKWELKSTFQLNQTLRAGLEQHCSDLTDCSSRIKTFGANIHAIHYATTSKNAERIV